MRKPFKYWPTLLLTSLLIPGYLVYSSWKPKILSVHIGKTYEQVISDSTFPVESSTAIYPGDPDDPEDPPRPGSTWISNPTVIEFDDATHGFKLPPTVFGAVTYSNFKVATLTTSPMSKTMPFGQAVEHLQYLQNMLKKQQWKLEIGEKNTWFKIESTAERVTLQESLFDQANSVNLYIPGKYALLLAIKCYTKCTERNPNTAKYLIDISVGSDKHNK